MAELLAAALGRVTGQWNNLRESWSKMTIDSANSEAEEQA